MRKRIQIPLRLKLFLPIAFIIVAVVLSITIWFVITSIDAFNQQIETNQLLEVKTIYKMFERESILKLDKVQGNLKVASHLFYQNKLNITPKTKILEVENQESGVKHHAKIRSWIHNGYDLTSSNSFVDSMQVILGGTISIFQKIDSGYVRIATNVLKVDGTRAIGTFIPNHSPVIEAINNQKTYFGRAFVVNEWYITAYQAIIKNNQIIGMIYVGDKEKDLNELKKILATLKIGKTGYPFVCDKTGNMLIHPILGEKWNDTLFINKLKNSPSGFFKFHFNGKVKNIAYVYFPKFELYIGSSILIDVENKELINKAIIGASMVGIFAILVILAFLYFFTTDRISHFFTALEISNKKLASAEMALKQSEKLATMGQISAGIAHELNNPLGVITMYSNIILEELDKKDPMVHDVELIVEQANRCKNIVGGLLNFARKSKINPHEVNVIEFVQRSLESIIIPENVTTQLNFHIIDTMFMIDVEQMMQVFTNIEKNAIEAMPKGGLLSIDIGGDDISVIIKISDTGIGIPDENLEKLFTPFFTTKEVGKGTGLGLPLVYGIIKMHKGKIEVQSNCNAENGKTGTTFTLTIPRIS